MHSDIVKWTLVSILVLADCLSLLTDTCSGCVGCRECAVKFNDYFEFPRQLDMVPYTVQGLAKLEGLLCYICSVLLAWLCCVEWDVEPCSTVSRSTYWTLFCCWVLTITGLLTADSWTMDNEVRHVLSMIEWACRGAEVMCVCVC